MSDPDDMDVNRQGSVTRTKAIQYKYVALVGVGTDGTPSTVPAPGVISDSATIANGASLSDAIDLDGRQLVSILMPAAWTSADMTFMVSLDGVTYYSKLNGGAEYKVSDLLSSNPTASQAIDIPYGDFVGFRYVKLQSGTAGTPVNQGAARAFTVGLAA